MKKFDYASGWVLFLGLLIYQSDNFLIRAIGAALIAFTAMYFGSFIDQKK